MKMVIFGAGDWGKQALEHYGENAVEFFCDNNPEKAGQTYCGKKIISFKQLKKNHSYYQIVIAVRIFYPIANQLSQNGIENYKIFEPTNLTEFTSFVNETLTKFTCIEIKKNKMFANYAKNKKLLSSYPYLFGKIPEFKYSQNKVLDLDEETPYFFKDLSKPFLIYDLSHPVHIKFLFDNVRASEDVAMDNHIYLYYANEQKFLEMLCLCDLKPLLKRQKFVFLLGEQTKHIYPIDFKRKYSIDYALMPFKPLRANEIKRIVLYRNHALSGQDFLFQICAANKNILPVFCPDLFNYLPKLKEEILKFKFNIKDLFYMRCPSYSLSNPDIFRFISMTLYNNGKINSRISPTVLLDPHLGDAYYHLIDVYKSFPYRKCIGLIRNPIVRFASVIKHQRKLNRDWYGEGQFTLLYRYSLTSLLDKFKCFKLEYLKHNALKGTKALCKYLQVPYDRDMLHPEKVPYIATCCSTTQKNVMGFESTPKRDISDVLSERDLQRLTPIFEPILKYYGYEYKKYEPLPEKNLRKIYSEPFLFEKGYKISDRGLLTEIMLYLHNLAKSGKFHLPPFIDIK